MTRYQGPEQRSRRLSLRQDPTRSGSFVSTVTVDASPACAPPAPRVVLARLGVACVPGPRQFFVVGAFFEAVGAPRGRFVHARPFIVPVALAGSAGLLIAAYERRILAQLATTPDPDTSRDFTFPAERTGTLATPDGGRLHVEECGSGRPVVLLHGHGGALGVFALLAARLAVEGQRVVAVDHRGFGRSSPVPPMFGFRGLVDDAATVLEALDLRRAIVVGHSMGGAVALGLSIHRPDVVADRVAALVLLNSSARGPADRPLVRAQVTALDWAFLEGFSRHPRHGVVLARATSVPSPVAVTWRPLACWALTVRWSAGGDSPVGCSASTSPTRCRPSGCPSC